MLANNALAAQNPLFNNMAQNPLVGNLN